MPNARARSRARARRLGVGVITATTAMLTTTALAFTAHAAAAPPPVPKDDAIVLDWLALTQSDARPDHVQIGSDWHVYAHLYENKSGKPGKKIGDASSRCSAVDTTPQGVVTLCQRVLRADDGDISLSDTLDRFGDLPHGGKSAVTGGTGKYKEAEGQAKIIDYGDHTAFRITLDD